MANANTKEVLMKLDVDGTQGNLPCDVCDPMNAPVEQAIFEASNFEGRGFDGKFFLCAGCIGRWIEG